MSDISHFERLGLPRRFLLSRPELDRAWREQSRLLHPDFHQEGSTSEQAASLELSARLNEAYATLKEPFSRAEYLMRLEGGPTASDQKEMPAEFLEEVLDLRMAIAELEDEPQDSPARLSMTRQLQARRDALLQEVGERFDSSQENRADTLREIRRRLNALKYIQNLLRDLQ